MKRTISKSLGDGTEIEIPDPDYYYDGDKFIKKRKKLTNITPKKKKRK